MKAIIAILAATFTIGNARAAEVLGARIDAAKKTLTVDVRYGGGCQKHTFKLVSTGGCLESYPLQCGYRIVDTTKEVDYCEAIIHTKAVFTFAEMGWNDSYFNGARIGILGDNDTRAVVSLPFKR